MKVIRLQSNNVMRLVAVDITPAGHLVTIGGRNGAGKSSVLNSLAMALGGADMVPSEPIRAGEAEAKITVDLGDLVVTRKFKREQVPDLEATPPESLLTVNDGPQVTVKGVALKWGDTTSTLVVTNKDGAKYPSPQALLDKLLGKLTFDPLAFARDDAKRQDETLRKLVGLDVTAIEERRKNAFAQRAILKKSRAIKEAQLLAMPHHAAPLAEVSLDEVSAEMLRAEELRKVADEAERAVEKVEHRIGIYTIEEKALGLSIQKLEKQLSIEKEKMTTLQNGHQQADAEKIAAQDTAKVQRDAVPDVAIIRAKLTDVEMTNAKVRANQRHAEVVKEVVTIEASILEQDNAVKVAEVDKRTALAATTFPVPGLGLGDDGVTFGGLPFSQASSSEQLRVSVAIGLALNPQLKVLLIRGGNLLDDVSLKLVADQAAAADAQVWMEYVTADAADVQVMIEDGNVAK